MAYALYIRLPVDYYDYWMGVWEPPEPGSWFDENHVYKLSDGSP